MPAKTRTGLRFYFFHEAPKDTLTIRLINAREDADAFATEVKAPMDAAAKRTGMMKANEPAGWSWVVAVTTTAYRDRFIADYYDHLEAALREWQAYWELVSDGTGYFEVVRVADAP